MKALYLKTDLPADKDNFLFKINNSNELFILEITIIKL